MARTFAILIVLMFFMGSLAGCKTKVVYRDRLVEVERPVPQPCAGERPDKVVPMKDRIPQAEWDAMDHVQRTAEAGKQALARQGYGEKLDAATAGCP